MINVLELIDGGFIGGGQTHILSLVKCLDKNKYTAIISASDKGEFRNEVLKNRFRFAGIELPKFYRSKYLKDLDRIVKENSIDIIHSHGGVAGMYARFYKKKFNKVKVIHTIHGIHYINSSNIFKKQFSKLIEQYLVPYTDKFICVSDSDLRTAIENKIVSEEKTVVIKNGIDTGRFTKKEKNKILMDKYELKDDDIVIGNISRFDFQKNQRYIIKHTEDTLEKYPNVKILLAGDGKLLDDCKVQAYKSACPERFIFTEEIKDTEDHYSLLDVFIFPSMWEGLSISLIEAMATSKCILASNIPANLELISDGINGFTFDLQEKGKDKGKEKDGFTDKLEKLINDRDLRNKLSDQAFKDSKNYTENKMTGKIEKEYLKLIT